VQVTERIDGASGGCPAQGGARRARGAGRRPLRGRRRLLVKPFETEELVARLRALLRRNRPPEQQFAFADLSLEVGSGAARRAGARSS
jgi:hypothetical protein